MIPFFFWQWTAAISSCTVRRVHVCVTKGDNSWKCWACYEGFGLKALLVPRLHTLYIPTQSQHISDWGSTCRLKCSITQATTQHCKHINMPVMFFWIILGSAQILLLFTYNIKYLFNVPKHICFPLISLKKKTALKNTFLHLDVSSSSSECHSLMSHKNPSFCFFYGSC